MDDYFSRSVEDTEKFAEEFSKKLTGNEIIAMYGGLGAGKTSFTRGLARGLEIEDSVSSPTFAIVNEYSGIYPLYHFDMYRITSAEELETTGFYDYPLEDSVFALEWSENISQELAEDTIYIDIQRIDDETRLITVKGDERFC